MNATDGDCPEIDVRYTAGLARLSLTEEEIACFEQQFGEILSLVDTLTTLDVEGVEPTAHPAPVLDVLREDVDSLGLSKNQVLRNSPDSSRDQIRVPKVVDS